VRRASCTASARATLEVRPDHPVTLRASSSRESARVGAARLGCARAWAAMASMRQIFVAFVLALMVNGLFATGLAGSPWMDTSSADSTNLGASLGLWKGSPVDPDEACTTVLSGTPGEAGIIDFCTALQNTRAFAVLTLIAAFADLIVRLDALLSGLSHYEGLIDVPVDRTTLAITVATSALAIAFGSAACTTCVHLH